MAWYGTIPYYISSVNVVCGTDTSEMYTSVHLLSTIIGLCSDSLCYHIQLDTNQRLHVPTHVH